MKLTVIAVSKNTNSFGLKSIILLSASGEGLELLKSSDLPEAGSNIEIDYVNGKPQLPKFHSYECPRQLPAISPKQASKIIKSIKQLISLKK